MKDQVKTYLRVCVPFLLALAMCLGVYAFAYFQTKALIERQYEKLGVEELQLIDIRPSLTHGVQFHWQIILHHNVKGLPNDTVYWRLLKGGKIDRYAFTFGRKGQIKGSL